jgi:hypothetical protein
MSLKKHFNKFALLGVTSALALTSVSAMAGEQPTREELLAMLYKQQSQLNELHKMLKQTQAKVDETKKQADEQAASPSFLDTVQIGGALEFEATSSEGFDGTDSSDLSLAKAELSFSAKPHEYVTTNIVALYEDGSDNIVLDEATIEIANKEEFPLYTQAGKWAVPFGNYDTAMSSDPITKDLGEIKENALLVGATYQGFTAEGFVYNGDTQEAGEGNNIDQYGVNVGYEGEAEGVAFAGGVGYINNIADSDGMTDKVSNSSGLDGYTGGLSLHGSVSVSDVTFNAGYVKATDALASSDLAFNGQGAQPEAWNTELSYTTNILGKGTTFAATYQGSDEALALELPENRYGAAVTVEVYDQTAITLEYLADEDYSTSEGGTGADGHTATAKLAVEF